MLLQHVKETLSNVDFYLFIIWRVKPYNDAFSVELPFSAECWLLLKSKLGTVATLLQGMFVCRNAALWNSLSSEEIWKIFSSIIRGRCLVIVGGWLDRTLIYRDCHWVS